MNSNEFVKLSRGDLVVYRWQHAHPAWFIYNSLLAARGAWDPSAGSDPANIFFQRGDIGVVMEESSFDFFPDPGGRYPHRKNLPPIVYWFRHRVSVEASSVFDLHLVYRKKTKERFSDLPVQCR